MDKIEQYLINSSDAFELNLYRPGSNELVLEETFNPEFTYPIFGEEETIIGYKGLRCSLRFRATDLKPVLQIEHEKEWKGFGETKSMDIKALLKDFSPDFDFPDSEPTEDTGKDWKPPGELLHSYKFEDRSFEIWQTTLGDKRAKEMFQHIQIFIPFYIEGGVLQDLNDPEWTLRRWKLFFVYETTPLENSTASSSYTFAGFATSYRLWVFPARPVVEATGALPSPPSSSNGNGTDEPSKSWPPKALALNEDGTAYAGSFSTIDSPSRERISQFIILPPFQGQSHGSHLYNTMATMYLADRNVFELSVEDPNYSFDDLRDWCDLVRLHKDPQWAELSINADIPSTALSNSKPVPVDTFVVPKTTKALRQRYKISSRQFSRLTEMQLLSQIPERHRTVARITRKHNAPDPNDRRYYYWRLLVKARIYARSQDQLQQLEHSEQVSKMNESLAAVQEEYTRILGKLPSRLAWAEQEEAAPADEAKRKEIQRKRGLKRAIKDEDDDEKEDEEAGSVAHKRPKTVTVEDE